MPNKIFILGSGHSLIDYKYQEGDTVWCPASMVDENIIKVNPVVFGMHKGQEDCEINLNNYPIEEISRKYESCFFTNTVSYMLAYALYTGVEEIEMHGVDMSALDEYYAQRPSVLYWVGYLRGKGVKIEMKNEVDKPVQIYGYESMSALKTKIRQMRDNAIINKDAYTEKEKDQYLGFIHALNMIEREL